jgi:hypothetical protein
MPKDSTTKAKHPWLVPAVVSAVCAAILFVIANSAFWVNRYVFDTNNFTQVATTSLTSESSRKAIAEGIVNKALADYPTVKNVIDNPATNVISGVLGSDQVENILTKAITKLQVSVTSSDPQSLVIDLSGPKDFLIKIVDVVSKQRQVNVDPNNIPSEIVLINKDNIPNFYKYSIVFLWLGPIALLGGLALIAYPHIKWRKDYKVVMMVQGGALLVVSLLALLIGPLFRPPLLAHVPTAEARTVVTNLYNAFIGTFNNQTVMLTFLAVAVMLVSAALLVIPVFVSKVRTRR